MVASFPKDKNFQASPNFRGIIIEYLRDNLNDPEGMEIIEWSEPERYKSGNGAINLKFRAKTPLGGKRVDIWRFWLQGGKVIDAFPLEDLHLNYEMDGELAVVRKWKRQAREKELRGEAEPGLQRPQAGLADQQEK